MELVTKQWVCTRKIFFLETFNMHERLKHWVWYFNLTIQLCVYIFKLNIKRLSRNLPVDVLFHDTSKKQINKNSFIPNKVSEWDRQKTKNKQITKSSLMQVQVANWAWHHQWAQKCRWCCMVSHWALSLQPASQKQLIHPTVISC